MGGEEGDEDGNWRHGKEGFFLFRLMDGWMEVFGWGRVERRSDDGNELFEIRWFEIRWFESEL